MRKRRGRAAWAGLMAALASIPLLGAVPGAAAQRPPVGAGGLTVRIEEFTPAIPREEDTLTVGGTISNEGTEPVTDVAAVLRISPTPLVTRTEIDNVLAGSAQRDGLAVPGARQVLAAELAPGASLPFELQVPVADLDLGPTGVYSTGVEAVGATDGAVVRQDLDRTFLPWWPESSTTTPLLVTTLWPLTGQPVRDGAGVLPDEAPAVELSPTGRLDTLLAAAAERPGVATLVLDPELVEAAAQMADGYKVGFTDPVPGTRRSEVRSWLTRLRAAVSDPRADVTGSLYAQPDVVAAHRGRVLGRVLGQRRAVAAAAAEVLGTEPRGTVVLVPGGHADAATLAALARARAGTVQLADTALPLATPATFTASGALRLRTEDGELPVLLADSAISAALSAPMADSAEVTAVRQQLLAQTLVTAEELPATQRLIVAGPPARWGPTAQAAEMVLEVMADTPWIVPTSVAGALAREPSTLPRGPVVYSEADRAAELPPDHVSEVRDQYRGIRDYTAIATDPDAVPATLSTAPTRLVGGFYREAAEQRAAVTDQVSQQVRELEESVRVVSSGSITVSGTSGTIPITVENSGSVPVSVGLRLTSTPAQLFTAEPVPAFEIPPGRRTSVEVTAQVAAAGPIPVVIALTTPEGRVFGEPGLLTVRSSAYANAARILVRASLGLLVLAVAVHALRRARRRRSSSGVVRDDEHATGPTDEAPAPLQDARDGNG